jgi:hypothetical protein
MIIARIDVQAAVCAARHELSHLGDRVAAAHGPASSAVPVSAVSVG